MNLFSNYSGFKNTADTYYFRNGLKIKTSDTVDTATILLVFLKKDYGDLKDEMVVIDVGANIGVYSLYAGTSAKNVKVLAFEPMREAYELLQENVRLNNLDSKIKAFNLGLSARRETRKLLLGTSSVYSSMYKEKGDGLNDNLSARSVEINCIPLQQIFDDNNLKFCDLLKMDCEGAEFESLYATPQEYLDKIREIRMEFHNLDTSGDRNVDALIDYLTDRGFEVTHLEKHSRKSFGQVWFVNKHHN
ncbi:MAG: FkbM family methyltransferase [bacterium]|nr:FkbM family methyltransferase [bacterium]